MMYEVRNETLGDVFYASAKWVSSYLGVHTAEQGFDVSVTPVFDNLGGASGYYVDVIGRGNKLTGGAK